MARRKKPPIPWMSYEESEIMKLVVESGKYFSGWSTETPESMAIKIAPLAGHPDRAKVCIQSLKEKDFLKEHPESGELKATAAYYSRNFYFNS